MGHETVRRLLLRGPNWIGDAVMCEPALAATRRLLPSAHITLLVKPPIAELFKGHPGFDRILVYEDPGSHSGLGGKWTLAETLRRQGFDMAILFQNAMEAALLTFLAGIPRRYGYGTDGRGLLLSDSIPVPDRSKTGHQVDYYLELLGPLGVKSDRRVPRLYVSDQEEQAVNQTLAEAGIEETDLLIGLNPGSTYGSAKRWLPERFAEAVDRVVRAWGAESGGRVQVVIVGAKGEEALGQAIAEQMQTKPLRLAGRTTVRELLALIKRCGLFLTNDTGPMHIATAFGVPVVAVFGPTDVRTTAPFGGRPRVVRHQVECAPCLLRECPIDHRCMTRVTVGEVYEAALRQLESRKSESRESESSGPSTLRPSDLTNCLEGVTVFLDRDGTLNRDTGYVKAPEELELFSDAAQAVARLNRAGARLVLITNQSGIGRGMLSQEDLERVHMRLRTLLSSRGATLEAIYYCPHHPEDGCACRKPHPALIERAVEELGLDLSRAYLVGDQKRDIDLAHTIAARSVLVTTGPTSWESLKNLEAGGLPPDYVAASLSEAAEWILQDAQVRVTRSATTER